MNSNNVIISSIQDLLDNLDKICSDTEYTYLYRGHSKNKYKLIPGLFRPGAPIKKEYELCQKIYREYPHEFENSSRLQKLIKMQHYGVPTRLLDFSMNPLIALYFAVTDNMEDDGEFIIYKVNNKWVKYEDCTKVNAIACFSYMRPDAIENLLKYCTNNKEKVVSDTKAELKAKGIYGKIFDRQDENYGANNFIRMLEEENISGNFCWKNLLNPMVFLANKTFDRASVQDSAFVIFGSSENKIKTVEEKGIYLIRIKVPSNCKEKILKHLRLIRVSDSTVYPSLASRVNDMLGKKASWGKYVEN